MDRVAVSEAVGRAFESHQAHLNTIYKVYIKLDIQLSFIYYNDYYLLISIRRICLTEPLQRATKVNCLKMIKLKHIKTSRKKTIILITALLLAIIAILFITKNESCDNCIQADCSRVGNILTPRINHLATVLNDGKVLIAGGYNAIAEDGSLAKDVNVYKAELFDPKTKHFSSIGTANHPHENKITIKTKDGKVVFINFIDSNYNMWNYYGVEIFNPKQNKFIKSNTPPFKRYLSALDVENGKILLILGSSHVPFGGSPREKKDYKNSDLYLYDVNSDKMSKIGIIDDVLNEPHLIKANENEVLLVSSERIKKQKPAIYSVNLNNFKIKKVGNFSLFKIKTGPDEDLYIQNAFKINKNKILIVYNNAKLEIYNTETNSSTLLTDIKIKNTEQTFLYSVTANNSFYQIDNSNYLIMQDGKKFYLLNITNKTLKKICRLNIDAESPTITFLNNNQILLTGGEIYEGLNSIPTSQNKAYICKIK